VQLAKNKLLVPCRGAVSYLLNINTGEVDMTLAGTKSSFASMLCVNQQVWALDNNGTLARYTLSNP
jgi:hypothetical protein